MYNWKREFSVPVRLSDPADHKLGYVTRLGDFTHPRKDKIVTLTPVAHRSKTPDTGEIPPNIPKGESIATPGDFHLLPHEWAFRISKIPVTEYKAGKAASMQDEPRESDCGKSVPTTVVRAIDTNLQLEMDRLKPFLNRVGENRWYHPLSSNDVSAYGNSYVRTMHTTPFAKTQLLVSR